ncbi:MAG: ABC transporter ATP-binding protein [archaeon]|nr:ABC transporter ATP-binding protein [archaeon]
MRIQMQNVNFGYTHDNLILHDINLDREGPGLYCIIGPNGVGKSTMIKCINRLLHPSSGTVLLDGEDVSRMHMRDVARKIGYVPVHTDDVFSMTVFETVLIGRANRQRWKTSTEDILKVHKILEALDLEEFAERSFRELSAGQHQRVAIARGLVQETEILILDEPTSNLDIKHQIFVTELLREIALKKGIMVIMISHNLEIAAKYADQIIMMERPGTIRVVGPAVDVITSDNLRDVYEVDTEVVLHEGRPAIHINQMD